MGCKAADPTVHFDVDDSDLIQAFTDPNRLLLGLKFELSIAKMTAR